MKIPFAYFGATALTLMLSAPSATAATWTVTSTADMIDISPGNGVCGTSAGTAVCTLRAAVMEANATTGPHVIELPAGDFVLTIAGVGNDDASAGDLDILQPTVIRGAGADATRIDGDSAMRVFHVHSGGLDLEDLTVQNGRADNMTESTGGGIRADAGLGLLRVRMRGNVAESGGAIHAQGTAVEIVDSVLTGNEAINPGFIAEGHAFAAYNTEAIVLRSTIHGNALPIGSDGGDNIYVDVGSLDLVNSTVTGNEGTGVEIRDADGFISHSTIAGNHGAQLSTFSFSGTDTVEIVASVLQRAPFGFTTCANQNHASLGYNISDDGTCGLTATGDLENADALLGSLQMNGGPTPTRLPQSGSPAVNLVPPGSCLDEDGSSLDHDQRGLPRPAPGTTNCDAGAVETGNQTIFADRFEP
jgi:CSLREA domain-containing protein